MPGTSTIKALRTVKQPALCLLWNNFTHVKILHIHRCENYLQKYCANICVIHIYFVILRSLSLILLYSYTIMSEKERIEQVIKSLGLTARQFAAEIRVQPGTISNMMAGRNNPSLEVMKRIMQRYPTINPEWLIAGNGEMWRTVPGQEAGLFDKLPPAGVAPQVQATPQKEEPQTPAAPSKTIKNIVVYYTDGTYEEYTTNPLTR